MNFNKKKSDIVKIDTLIYRNTVICGEISGKGNYKIDGKIEGNITVDGDVVIDKSALVYGDICGNNVIIFGNVNGNITANGCLTVKAGAVVFGNSNAKNIAVEDGADICGNCAVKSEKKDDKEEDADELQ